MTAKRGVSVARSFRPDVVSLDIGLTGLSGYQVAEHLRASRETKHAVLVAKRAMGAEDRRRTLDVGSNHYLVKPVDLSTRFLLGRPSFVEVLLYLAANERPFQLEGGASRSFLFSEISLTSPVLNAWVKAAIR